MKAISRVQRSEVSCFSIQGSCAKKTGLWKKKFLIILRLEMILIVVSHERKNITFYEKNFKLMKNNTLINILCKRIFPYCCFLPIL